MSFCICVRLCVYDRMKEKENETRVERPKIQEETEGNVKE